MKVGEGAALRPDVRGGYHPRSEEEIVELIRHARSHGCRVRVVGSGRSEPGCIHTDAALDHRPFEAIEISLDKLRAVRFDDARREVTAQAGCKITHDPHDPTGTSILEEGLCAQLDRRGWSLPILTGGSCQAVGGYVSTGSDGGSLQHAIGDAIVGLRLIDGRGEVHELRVEDDSELFLAAGVSMGLLGVITAVTFRCEPRFDITGEEWGHRVEAAEIGLGPEGPDALASFLARHEYARIMWWPQPTVKRAVMWSARRMGPADYQGEAVDAQGQLVRQPYIEVPEILGTSLPLQVAGSALLTLMGRAPSWYQRVTGDSAPAQALGSSLRQVGRRTLKPLLLTPFIHTESAPVTRFRDSWWQGLAMDAQIDERLMPVTFTEAWIPLSRAAEALTRLADFFAEGGDDAAGRFITELYAGRESPFWLSPAHGEGQLRINVFWHKYDAGDPAQGHFLRIWELLEDLKPRYHWGKSLPGAELISPEGWRDRFPRMDDFLRLREVHDPEQLFVNDYWRGRLGIPPTTDTREAARGSEETPTVSHQPSPEWGPPPKPWPMLFTFRPATRELSDRASDVIHNTATIEAPIAEVFDAATRPEEGPEWVARFRGIEWLTEPMEDPGSASIETFDFMSFRMRCLEVQRPFHWLGSVDACSLPLAEEMSSEWRFYPLGPSRTLVHWWIRFQRLSWMRPFYPVARPFFDHLFAVSTRQLKTKLESRPRDEEGVRR